MYRTKMNGAVVDGAVGPRAVVRAVVGAVVGGVVVGVVVRDVMAALDLVAADMGGTSM